MEAGLIQKFSNLEGRTQVDLDTVCIKKQGSVVVVEIREGVYIDSGDIAHQISVCKELMQNQPFAVLVDARSVHSTTREARELLANDSLTNRVALAIVSTNLPARLIANFYMRVNSPKTPTRLFRSHEEALKWLGSFEQLKL